MFDVSFAFVTSRLEKRPMVVVRQVWCEQPHLRQRDRTVRELAENGRKASACSCSLDAIVGGVLG